MNEMPVFHRPAIDPSARAAVIEALKAHFGDRCSTSEALRTQHGSTITWLATQAPDAVVFAHTTEEVAEIVTLCAAHRMPVIPYGAGTSLEGQLNAPFGGVSIDLSQMKKIIAVHAEDFDCVVEPGVTRKQLNDYLRDTGLFFPIDPGADASIGGMVATRASGTNAVRYGTMKDNVIALTVVAPDGSIVKTAGRAKKTSAGYDLTRLYVGSEGTLGIVTEITLRLFGQPEAISAATCQFPSVAAACDAVIETIQSGLPVARIELLSPLIIRAINLYSKLDLAEAPMLLLEFHGSEAGVAEQAERFGAIAAEHGGGPFRWTARPEERTKLWQARHDSYWATPMLRPGARPVPTDVCVPISRLAECVAATQADGEASGVMAPIIGHVGDGNFHAGVLVYPDDPADVARVTAFVERLVRRAIAMEGTCSGEHGIGQDKIKYMPEEHAPSALELMRALKRTIDPDGIMNPGKMFSI